MKKTYTKKIVEKENEIEWYKIHISKCHTKIRKLENELKELRS